MLRGAGDSGVADRVRALDGSIEHGDSGRFVDPLSCLGVDCVAATVDDSHGFAPGDGVADQVRSVEQSAPYHRTQLFGVALDRPGEAVGDDVEQVRRLLDQPVPPGHHLGIGQRVGDAQQRVVHDLPYQGARGDQLVGFDRMVGFGVSHDMEDVWPQRHRRARGGPELAQGSNGILGQ